MSKAIILAEAYRNLCLACVKKGRIADLSLGQRTRCGAKNKVRVFDEEAAVEQAKVLSLRF